MNEYRRTGELTATIQARLAREDEERRAYLDRRILETTCRFCGRTAHEDRRLPLPGVCTRKSCVRRYHKERNARCSGSPQLSE